MVQKIMIMFCVLALVFPSPGYSSGLPEEITVESSDKQIPLDLALEWLRGEAELPEEYREEPISVPLFKHKEKEDAGADDPQIRAISSVFRQYNDDLDSATALNYADIIKDTSERFGEDPFVIAALIVVESEVRHDALSKGGDYGLMQVRWRVHRKRLIQRYPTIKTDKDMFKPKENIIAGTEIFSYYRKSANGNTAKALRAYSGGSSSHRAKVDNVVEKIKSKYKEFRKG